MNTIPQAVDERINTSLGVLWTSCPAIIKEVQNNEGTVTIQIKALLSDKEDNKRQSPLVYNVPVINFKGGNTYIKMPIVAGDVVMAFFSKFAMDTLLRDENIADPIDARQFNFNDAIVLGGFFTSDDGNKTIPTDDVEVVSDGKVNITATEVVINSGVAKAITAISMQAAGDPSHTHPLNITYSDNLKI